MNRKSKSVISKGKLNMSFWQYSWSSEGSMASTKTWRRCFTVHERMAQKNAPVTVTKFHRGKVRELSFPDLAS